MSKHLTTQELRAIASDALKESMQTHNPETRAAAVIIAETITRFATTPPAPETTLNDVNTAGERLVATLRRFDAEQLTAAGPIKRLTSAPYDHATAYQASRAVQSLAGVAGELADALDDMAYIHEKHRLSLLDTQQR